MVRHVIRCGAAAWAIAAGSAGAAILDDAQIGVMDGWQGGAEAPSVFDLVAEDLVVEGAEGEPGFSITCWDCGAPEPGEDEMAITGTDEAAAIPLPAAGLLLLGGLGALGWAGRRRR